MLTQAKWIFVLIGKDKTGKTGFQKRLLRRLTSQNRDDKLDCNGKFEIMHPNLIRKIGTVSFGNRSIQEKIQDYKSIDEYFANHFKDADICIISTHLNLSDVQSIIKNCHKKFYNVCAVFFSNSLKQNLEDNSAISEFNWDDRWLVENPLTEDEDEQGRQLDVASDSFVQMLIERTRGW